MTYVSGAPKDLSVSFGSVTAKAWPPAFPNLRSTAVMASIYWALPVDLSSHTQPISPSLQPCDVCQSP